VLATGVAAVADERALVIAEEVGGLVRGPADTRMVLRQARGSERRPVIIGSGRGAGCRSGVPATARAARQCQRDRGQRRAAPRITVRSGPRSAPRRS